ncbi:unnamed protein product [Amaranthus hypochondriacus]
MAAIPSSAFLPPTTAFNLARHFPSSSRLPPLPRRRHVTSFTVQAAKLPSGVEVPKLQPKFKPPFLGFTKTAEIWNSRASMIGLIGVFIVELIMNKGILQTIGVDVGKGIDIPL